MAVVASDEGERERGKEDKREREVSIITIFLITWQTHPSV